MFDRASYSVTEVQGSVEVCVDGDGQAILERPVSFIVDTVPLSAALGEDYMFMNAVTLMFTSDSMRQCVSVSIQPDNVVEDLEVFRVNLASTDGAVMVLTPTVNVEIEDASGLRVMFQSIDYQVEEGGETDVCLELLDPIDREVQVALQVAAGIGKCLRCMEND